MSITYSQALVNFIRNGDAFSHGPAQQQSYLGLYYQQPITSANTAFSYDPVQQRGNMGSYCQQPMTSANTTARAGSTMLPVQPDDIVYSIPSYQISVPQPMFQHLQQPIDQQSRPEGLQFAQLSARQQQSEDYQSQISALQPMAYQPHTLAHQPMVYHLGQPEIYEPQAMDQQLMVQQSRPIAQQSWPGGLQFPQLSPPGLVAFRSTQLQLAVQKEDVQPVRVDKKLFAADMVKVNTQVQGGYQLEAENIHSQSSPQESPQTDHRPDVVPLQLVTNQQDQLAIEQEKVGLEEHVQTTKADDHEAQVLIDEFKNKGQYGEKYSCEENHKEEVSVNRKNKEKQADGDLCPDFETFSSRVANGSEITDHEVQIKADEIKGEGHYGRNLNSEEPQEEAPANKGKEAEIGLTEQNKMLTSCTHIKEEIKESGFKIDKADKIKSAIKQGEVRVEDPAKSIKVDVHPTPVNMVEVNDQKETPESRLISEGLKAIDPKVLVLADEHKGTSRYDQRKNSKSQQGPRESVTSQMLLNKFQLQQEREKQCHEKRNRHVRGHWRCPFFMFCWDQGLRLPTILDCPECNGYWEEHRYHSSKRPWCDDRDYWPINKDGHNYRAKRVPVQDQLNRVEAYDRLENRASNHAPNKEPLYHKPKCQQRYHHSEQDYLQRHPGGLIKSQKGKAQYLRHGGREEERVQGKTQVKFQVWRIKQKADNIAPPTSASMVEAKSPTNNKARIGCLVQEIADDGKGYCRYEKQFTQLRHRHRDNFKCQFENSKMMSHAESAAVFSCLHKF